MSVSRFDGLFARAFDDAQPLSAHLELTRRCHLDCTMCYQTEAREEAPELSTAEWVRVIRELRELGTLFVLLSGGELFLRRDALDLARRAREEGMVVSLATTGTLLDEARAKAIAALAPSKVEITVLSLDPARHDGVTRVPGSLARTLGAVRRLRELGVPVLMKTPLVRACHSGVSDVRALAKRLGASHTVDGTITSRDDGDRTPFADRLTVEELAEFYALPEMREELAPPSRPDEPTCTVGRTFLVVGPRGDVVPCVSLPVPLANVRERPLAAIWREHPFLRRLRGIRHEDLPICKSCPRSGYCGRCPGMALVEDGDLFGPSSFACMNAAAKERAVLGYEIAAAPPAPPRRRRLAVLA